MKINKKKAVSLFMSLILVATFFTSCAPELTELTLTIPDQPSEKYDINEEIEFEIAGEPEDATLDDLKYYSSNEDVVSFENDKLETLSEGYSKIYVTSLDGKIKSNEITIRVEDKERIAEEEKAQAEANEKAASEIEEKISAIGDVTLDSEALISDARSEYDEASDDAKALVTNYFTLADAETAYSLLVKEEEQRVAEAQAQAEAKAASEAQAKSKTESKAGGSGGSTEDSTQTSGTVYWVDGGEVYHVSSNCTSLKRSSNIRSGTIAQSGKSRVCKVCGQ